MSNNNPDVDLLSFNSISFRYDSNDSFLLNDFSMRLASGDHMVIKGESGSGKTTLFRLLLGFEHPQNGEIQYRGKALDHSVVKQLRKETAWLPQDLDLGSGTVKSLVDFLFQFEQNIAKVSAKDQIIEIFEQLGLPASVLEKEFANLSTGQRQRIGVAICYLLDKPLILLDEPTSALDSASKEKVTNLLFDNSNRTILSTSHDSRWIEKCNSVFELNR